MAGSSAPLDLSWDAALRRLRHYCATDLPVRVRRTRMCGVNDGTCERKEKIYWIEVEKCLDETHQLLVLVHEFAHAMSWPLDLGWGPDHTAHFGICYTRAYNAVFDPMVLP